MSNNNMEAILYLSSKQPSVNKVFNYKDTSINYNSLLDGYVIYLGETKTNIQYEATINMLREGSSYIKSIWDKSDRNIAWERTILNKELPPIENDEQGKPIKNTLTIYYPSITIKYFHPSHLYTPNPYWLKTQIEVKNPISITPNPLFPSPIFIVQVKRSDYDEETQYFFKDLLPDILEELDEINVNNLDRLDELRKLKNVLDKILRNWHNIYNNIPDISTDSPLQQLLSNLEKIAEEFTDKKLTNTIKTIKDLVKLITDKVQRKDFYWLKKVSDKEQEHIETYPIVCPGEYIQLKWHLDVGNNNPIDDFDSDEIINKNEIIDMVKFETPLFTGGKIVEKFGTGVDTKYTVEIFGKEYYNIVPTDFFDYEVGKWCYLMKVNAQLSGEHQSYGSSNIDSPSEKSEAITLLELINQERKNENLDELILNTYLITAAKNHAEDMSLKQYFDHINLEDETEADRIIKAGYLAERTYETEYTIGENIAKGYGGVLLKRIVEGWMRSTGHRANILNAQYKETGIGISEVRNDTIYFVQTFGYRSDGVNVGMESSYRITPFNFGGIIHQSNEMAISYENDLFIDFQTNFEKVFDMTHYIGRIEFVDYANDKAVVNIPIKNEETKLIENKTFELPIFYHCTGMPITEGGSNSFAIYDTCIVEKPKNENDFDNAYIIGHKDGLKECRKGVLFVFKTSEWINDVHYKYFIWDFDNNEYIEPLTRLDVSQNAWWYPEQVDEYICQKFFNNNFNLMFGIQTDLVTTLYTSIYGNPRGYLKFPSKKIVSYQSLSEFPISDAYSEYDAYNTNGYQPTVFLAGRSSHHANVTYYKTKNSLFATSGYPFYVRPIYHSEKSINDATWYRNDKNRLLDILGGYSYIVSYDIGTNAFFPPTKNIFPVKDNFPVGKYEKYYQNFKVKFDSLIINSQNATLNGFIWLSDAGTINDTWTIRFTDEFGNFIAMGEKTGEIGEGNITQDFYPINPNAFVRSYYFGITPDTFNGYFAKDETFSFKTYGLIDAKGYIGKEGDSIYNTVADEVFAASENFSPLFSINVEGIFDQNNIIWVYWKRKEDYYQHDKIVGYSGKYADTTNILPKDVPINEKLTFALENAVTNLGDFSGNGSLVHIIKL